MNIDKDFSRDIWCILGLPFDALTREQTANEIAAAIRDRASCFLSTPNLNFVCAAQTDKLFRESVINSDLSIVDGFPIVVVAKLLGIPIPERVGGSNLIEHLYREYATSPMKIFFLGGEPGIGAKASEMINQKQAGLLAVGYYDPGFGSVEDMSAPEVINAINAHDVDFLFVSIGAKKGQAWLEKNRHQLNTPVVGYMGAVINFFAGTVKRAPAFMQRSGLEWLWRIYQEPGLWRRYFNDAISFLRLLFCNIIPYWLWLKFNSPKSSGQKLGVTVNTELDGNDRLILAGCCTTRTIMPLRNVFKNAAIGKRNVTIDLQNVIVIDSAFLGLCLVLHKHLIAAGKSLTFINPTKDVKSILAWHKIDEYLV